MSEEEKIIDRVMMIDQWKVAGDIYTQDELNAIGELLDLYNKEKLNSLNLSEQLNKEKEKNKKIEDKIKEIIELQEKSNKDLVVLPNNECICLSDCCELIDYLKEILE